MHEQSEILPVLISVVTPSFNAADTLMRCIGSVKEQTVSYWEHIIVDDGSSDSSYEIITEASRNDPRIRSVQLDKNSGAGAARNRAIEMARGRYIAFLDADDQWHPQKLERQIAFMQRNKAAFSYTGFVYQSDRGSYAVSVPPTATYNSLLKNNVIGCLTAVYDTSQLGKVYMPNIRRRQDYALWLELLKRTDIAHGLDEPLAIYNVSDYSLSGSKWRANLDLWRMLRNVEKINPFLATYYLIISRLNRLLRSRRHFHLF
jgi:teichuronic acid biosynthesis glycosyltransferase TuaG